MVKNYTKCKRKVQIFLKHFINAIYDSSESPRQYSNKIFDHTSDTIFMCSWYFRTFCVLEFNKCHFCHQCEKDFVSGTVKHLEYLTPYTYGVGCCCFHAFYVIKENHKKYLLSM